MYKFWIFFQIQQFSCSIHKLKPHQLNPNNKLGIIDGV